MRYFLVAGEASGDLHAGELISALRELDPEAKFAFMGGEAMAKAAGTSPILHYKKIAYMGFGPVIRNYRSIRHAAKEIQRTMLRFAPDRVIAIDSSGFNLRYILSFAYKALPEAKRFYYIAPKVWAWKVERVKQLRKYCHEVLSILPFEEAFFLNHNIPCTYVGNPTVEELAPYCSTDGHIGSNNQHQLPISEKRPLIALLPGSRKQEIRRNLKLMTEVATSFTDYHFVIAAAPGIEESFYTPYLTNHVSIVRNSTYALLAASKAALVTSGTATLETALIGIPQVVIYRINGQRILNFLFDKLIKVPYISLVNLIAGREVVTELLAADATVQRIRKELTKILQPAHAEEIRKGYEQVRISLGKKNAAMGAAQRIYYY